jgi:3-isopropylmalate dehydratase small subunit
MTPFRLHTGLVAPMDRENVDTDAIIPKQFLKSIKRSGFGPNLFDQWRYLDPGEPGQDLSLRGPQCCWRARTSGAARRASTPRGRCSSSDFGR